MEPGEKWMRRGAVLACGLALLAGWQVYGRMITPLGKKAVESQREITLLKQRIEGAQKTISETWALEQGTSKASGELHLILSNIPQGSPMVWFPERMKTHFGIAGLAGAVTRLNTALDEPDLPDFERTYWAVELPVEKSSKGFRASCLAVTEIEKRDPSIRVLDVEIRKDANNPTRNLMVMNVSILSRKVEVAR